MKVLDGIAPVKSRNENVIVLLREVLEMAEAGDVHAAIVVMEHHDGTTSERWATMGGLYPCKLMGAIWVCLTRFTAHQEELERKRNGE